MSQERIIDRNVAELAMEESKIWGANINLARITPSLVDGLKLVARRLLYTMYIRGMKGTVQKVNTISGAVIGTIHPHGPSSVTDALVGLAQPWANMIPLIKGEGNFGTVSGDPAGADRYIKAGISDYAYDCFFADWKESSVDMVMGADNVTKEPLYLPAKYPNVLLNGLLGIGYGLSSNIPAFCFSEVIETTIKLMKNPNAEFLLIPDSPTGCDIVAGNFKKICETGSGVYTMRCKYDIDPDKNIITITALPYQVAVNTVRERIAEIKSDGGLQELVDMQDHTGYDVKLQLFLRGDVNPYKFMKKLIDNVNGLERSYPVNITVVEDYKSYDLSIRQLLLEWIRYRREQKRVVINHRRTMLLGEQRTNEVKIFIMQGKNLEETIQIFRSSRNRAEIEQRLIEHYADSPIRMDSLQAKTLSEMRMYELSKDTVEECIKRRAEIEKELAEVTAILAKPNGIDEVIIAELREGAKKYGSPRRSSVVPYKISLETEIEGTSILDVTPDGMVTRKVASNASVEPLPTDPNGFAIKVENTSSFVAIDESGFFSFINVKELPVDSEVPLNRFISAKLGRIVAILPYDYDSDAYCTLVSSGGIMKKFRISDMRPSRKPCIDLSDGDKLVKGIVSRKTTHKDILIFTDLGYGQRVDPNNLRITSYQSKGIREFRLQKDDHIVGCYTIDPRNEYLLYVTERGKMRRNKMEFLPLRESKHDQMFSLIPLGERDHLRSVVGCNATDTVEVFFQDHSSEKAKVADVPEGTMGTQPVKIIQTNMTSNRIIRVKIV